MESYVLRDGIFTVPFFLVLGINILSKQVILFFWSGWFTAVIDFFCRGGWGVLLFLTYYIIFIQNLQCRSNHMIREPYDSTQAKIRANLESNLKILKRQSRITKSNLKTCMRSNRITNRILKSWRDRIESRIKSDYYYPDNESNLESNPKFLNNSLNVMMFGVSWGDIWYFPKSSTKSTCFKWCVFSPMFCFKL